MSADEDDWESLMADLDDEAEPEVEDEIPEPDDGDDFDDLAEFDDEPEPLAEVPFPETKAPAPVPTVLERDKPRRGGAGFIAYPATETSEAIRRTLISGHCASPQSRNPDESHQRCQKNGGGSRANPDKIYQPCPCPCHFPAERYECGNCGATIVAAPHWPADEDGDTRYVHVDAKTGRIVEGECPR